MIISDAHRLLFVHVQKTGGVTLTNMLKEQLPDVRSVSRRHAPLTKILRKEPELVDYWTFGFVRNPWDRMVSWWAMISNWRDWSQRSGTPIEDKWNEMWRGASEYTSFEQFVTEGPESFANLRRNQIDYLHAELPKRGVSRRADFIGRTENLEADTAVVFEHFGLPFERAAHDNRSKRTGYRDYYTPATRDRVAEVFAKDIAEFGYDF